MKDKVIVITGASAGIGESLAENVAKRGACVALLARREKELADIAARIGKNSLAVVCDVTSRSDVKRAFDAVIARFGAIDAWVNNAGRGITRMPSELTDEDIDYMMLVNLKSVVYCTQAVLPRFKEKKRGQIINVSSLLGRIPFAPMRSAYCASKHALNAYTASLRMELRGEFPEIRICSVHPGVVQTDFGLNALHGGQDSRGFPGAQPREEVAEVIAQMIESPRVDVYTREGAQQMISGYFSAPDMAVAEASMAMGPPRPKN